MAVADFSLEGKVAIVTGGSRGIGRSIALGLAEHGADVALAARKPAALEEAVKAIEALGRRAIGVPTNVRRTPDLKVLVERREFPEAKQLGGHERRADAVDLSQRAMLPECMRDGQREHTDDGGKTAVGQAAKQEEDVRHGDGAERGRNQIGLECGFRQREPLKNDGQDVVKRMAQRKAKIAEQVVSQHAVLRQAAVLPQRPGRDADQVERRCGGECNEVFASEPRTSCR